MGDEGDGQMWLFLAQGPGLVPLHEDIEDDDEDDSGGGGDTLQK